LADNYLAQLLQDALMSGLKFFDVLGLDRPASIA
jgi:hypothetical protein